MKVYSIQPKARRAFTLLELLIVVAVIALLMSLSIVVMSGWIDQAEEEATNATIQKVNKILEQRMEAFERGYTGAREIAAIDAMRDLLADPNGDGNQGDGIFGVKDAVVEILARKDAFRSEFPQQIVERISVFDPAITLAKNGQVIPSSLYTQLLAPAARAKLGLPDTTDLFATAISNSVSDALLNHDQNTESSEMLYFSLLKSTSFGSATVDDDRFTQNEVMDTDDDGLPEFVDAWGRPLRFYRWPTRLIDTNPPVPFQPDFAALSDGTDLAIDTNGDGTPDTGSRQITSDERTIANMLLKGLPPAPSILPNNAMPRDMLLIDPDDPVGRLYAELEHLNGTNGKPTLAAFFNEATFHTPDTFHAPLIMSIGVDEMPGLYEPWDIANSGNLGAYNLSSGVNQLVEELSDNITSRNKVSGGRK